MYISILLSHFFAFDTLFTIIVFKTPAPQTNPQLSNPLSFHFFCETVLNVRLYIYVSDYISVLYVCNRIINQLLCAFL